jgi:superfamily II RNA helicase
MATGILSALVFQEKSDNEPPLTPRLHTAKAQVIAIARGLGALQAKHGLPTNAEDYCKQNLNFGVVDVVYDWARGVPFNEVIVITIPVCMHVFKSTAYTSTSIVSIVMLLRFAGCQ